MKHQRTIGIQCDLVISGICSLSDPIQMQMHHAPSHCARLRQHGGKQKENPLELEMELDSDIFNDDFSDFHDEYMETIWGISSATSGLCRKVTLDFTPEITPDTMKPIEVRKQVKRPPILEGYELPDTDAEAQQL